METKEYVDSKDNRNVPSIYTRFNTKADVQRQVYTSRIQHQFLLPAKRCHTWIFQQNQAQNSAIKGKMQQIYIITLLQ